MSSEKNYLNDQYQSFFEDGLSKTDPELYKAISDELKRQQQHIELIASENIVSQAVLEAQGSVLTNKYTSMIIISFNFSSYFVGKIWIINFITIEGT